MESHPSAVLSFEDYSARIIQSWWRRLAEPTQVRGAQQMLQWKIKLGWLWKIFDLYILRV